MTFDTTGTRSGYLPCVWLFCLLETREKYRRGNKLTVTSSESASLSGLLSEISMMSESSLASQRGIAIAELPDRPDAGRKLMIVMSSLLSRLASERTMSAESSEGCECLQVGWAGGAIETSMV